MKQVLTIAGSDSGGGAGIQADIKAMSANGVFAMSVITAITAQNTEEITEVFELPTSIIAAQIDAVFDDFEVAAVKTGMLSCVEIKTLPDARQAAKIIHKMGCRNVLIKGGHLLADRGTDLLYDGKFFEVFKGEYINTPHTHGSGCTYASAIAAHLALGKPLSQAVKAAKASLTTFTSSNRNNAEITTPRRAA